MSAVSLMQGDTYYALSSVLKAPTGLPQPLTGASVRFIMKPKDGDTLKVDAEATVADEAAGRVIYPWTAGDVDIPGLFDAQWVVTFADGRTQHYPNREYLTIEIKPQLA